ncbi:hypothetical protein [Zeaxanthinibacter enoshimensis]|uniref:NIPSNAP protein n=1 Tax=Zeaxanthinibacter enoshimensis TaxID=392009 RepID=A0A4R6TMU4_9FLAO|nr:hypothetical protein [Zeaxanthinibacter enoshimensis]TDQ32852.1 hypothetical protein CLV82_0689 [Zeaxanthinibacter enoshimensis]
MRNLIFALLCCICWQVDAQEQLFAYDYRSVPAEEMKTFMENEAMYWSKIHGNLLKKGHITGWSMCTRVNGLESEPNVYFYYGIGSYENLDKIGEHWQAARDEVRGTMNKEQLADIDQRIKQKKFRVGEVLLNRISMASTDNPQWKYLVHNYTNATDVNAFLTAQDQYFKPHFEKHMKAGNTKQVLWLTAMVLSPQGYGYNWNSYTVDGFVKYRDIFNAWTSEVEWPQEGLEAVSKTMKNEQFYKRVIWQRRMWLDDQGKLMTN